ncbi:glycosyltransferase [Paraburkholderia silviterrae]|uniref:Glycosyltransferase n=1 Tax=Paraburkholderia silviterrae TaxID=2528715 RepID=A0A4R5M3A5_9BURK|nr:glycosyltransferase [Paraburkholderia silviterrae]TDG19719.1 glycosyltransferase [Paraburkholderia silviterrae]
MDNTKQPGVSHQTSETALGAVPPALPAKKRSRWYLPVKIKFALAVGFSLLWGVLSFYLARRWLADMGAVFGAVWAYLILFGIAILPGFMNAFMMSSLLMDRRPAFHPAAGPLPGISILVAAYNEEDNIAQTVESIAKQAYPGALQVIVVNDGSSDGTAAVLDGLEYPWLEVLHLPQNMGKARALTEGLTHVHHSLTVTVDGDSYLYRRALENLVYRYLSDPPSTRAVAGAVLVRNSRTNLVTRIQEWDYFHGIAATKRIQSLYQGTLVAQGAFSVYDTGVLRQVGGWPHSVGEDIVLTWAILKSGYRVGFAENACLFTNAPTTWRQFIRQRQRWSRGLIEAFKAHWQLLFKPRMTTLFIWWNLLFPYMDLVYTFAFLPGLVLALFGIRWIAGPMTLLVLPMAMLINVLMYRIQNRMFTEQGLKVRRNRLGFVCYSLLYGLVLQPACVVGYAQEFVTRSKRWGTK